MQDVAFDKQHARSTASVSMHAQHRQQQAEHVLLVQALPTATAGPAAGGSMEQAIDAIGLGWFHLFVLFCVSLIWAGGCSTAAAAAAAAAFSHSNQPANNYL
jgi:hypothetical protein